MRMVLEMEPPRCTAQHKGERVVRGKWVQHYEKKPQKIARLNYLAAIRAAMEKTAKDYYTVDEMGEPIPLRVSIAFTFKAGRRKDVGAPKVTRPDLDNMAKGLLDCLTQSRLLMDDSQVCDLRLSKTFGENPMVVIEISDFTEMRMPEEC